MFRRNEENRGPFYLLAGWVLAAVSFVASQSYVNKAQLTGNPTPGEDLVFLLSFLGSLLGYGFVVVSLFSFGSRRRRRDKETQREGREQYARWE